VGRVSLAETPLDELIWMTIGRGIATRAEARNAFGEVRLAVRGLSNPRLRDVSLNVRAGEIVGLAGLMGSGRTEIARAIFGLDKRTAGQVDIDGKPVDVRHPRDAIQLGIAYLPEDRAVEGLARDLDLFNNLSMASLPEHSPGGWIRHGELAAEADALIERLSVHPADQRYISGALSGGNQQKVVLGKWLATTPKVFILDEPTRGVDIGAKTAIRDIVLKLAADGVAVLVISSELSELFDMADRLYIVRDGKIAGEMPRDSFDEHRVIRMWSGVTDDAEVTA
jgi:ribose transport system ATP-binding protein